MALPYPWWRELVESFMMKMGEPGTSPHTWRYASWTSVWMPFPPPPLDTLMMMGKPMAAAQTGPDNVDGV